MDAARIQSKVTYGYAKAALYLGVTTQWYRPTATRCIDPSTLLGSLLVYADAKPNFEARVPSGYPNPQWYLACDRTLLQIGDYLVGASGTFFINMLQQFTPTGGIECNATVSLFRPGENQQPGPGYYGGNPNQQGLPLLSAVPCSLRQGTKGEADKTDVVNEPRQPWVALLMPSIAGIRFKVGDLMIDNQARRYILSSIETSDLGIRATAAYSGA